MVNLGINIPYMEHLGNDQNKFQKFGKVSSQLGSCIVGKRSRFMKLMVVGDEISQKSPTKGQPVWST